MCECAFVYACMNICSLEKNSVRRSTNDTKLSHIAAYTALFSLTFYPFLLSAGCILVGLKNGIYVTHTHTHTQAQRERKEQYMLQCVKVWCHSCYDEPSFFPTNKCSYTHTQRHTHTHTLSLNQKKSRQSKKNQPSLYLSISLSLYLSISLSLYLSISLSLYLSPFF